MLKKNRILLSVLAGALCFMVTPVHADTSGKTKYPVVLVHGLAGFDSVLADYFYGVKGALAEVGATDVYTPQVSGYDTSEVRGEQLLSYLEELRAVTGVDKFNLIGHSQGGIDSRYVASVRPDMVASVTSVGSPHRGSGTADLIKDSPLEGPAMAIANAVASLLSVATGNNDQQANAMGSLEALNSKDAAIFNAKYPEGLRLGECKATPSYNAGSWWWPNWVYDYSVNDGEHNVNDVAYYSWGGTYNPVFNSNVLDLADGLLAVTYLTIDEANDGVVGRCSTHLGKVIRDDYTMNHADEINGMFGLRGLGSTSPLPLYAAHAKRLTSAGL
ncbi:MAG: triacylglycerol lipase [Moritella sp.]|uniref:esterase/lipase family protein n=1 Tax=Moritella sp. TaxID=78556 RepID=UPI0029B770FF|nr:triacylglycerol lipase [Moritella sp.]MDX2321574.1 triacylglycerol lipase [Moritella sp.]